MYVVDHKQEEKMGQVKRIYVEKKAPYAVRAKELKEEVRQYLGITALRNVRH